MCSLNMGLLLFFTRDGGALMLDNPRAADRVVRRARCSPAGVKPELEVYNLTMLEEAERLVDAGLLPAPLNVGFVLGAPGQSAARGTWQNLCHAVSRLPAGANCSVIGIGRAQLPLSTMGLAPRRSRGRCRVPRR